VAERLLPHNLDAEKICIGAAMIDAPVLDTITPLLRPRDFYAIAHGKIFAAIIDLWSDGRPIDRISVAEHLRLRGELDAIGGAAALSAFSGIVQTSSSAAYYAKIVREKSRLRAIILAAKKIASAGYEGESDPDAAAAAATKALREATDDLAVPALRPLAEVTESYHAHMRSLPTYRTPWRALDRVTGGFTGDELVTWASDAGLGKSFLLAQLANHVATTYGPVAYFATEMGQQKTMQRLVALYSGISARAQREGLGPSPTRPLSHDERARIDAAVKALRRVPIYLSDETLACDDLIAQCRRLHRETKLEAVVIDTLGALADVAGHIGPGRDPGTHERQKRVVWALKSLAKDLGVPVHLAHHFSRDGAGTRNPVPSKNRLRDGGGLENTSTTIILPYKVEEREAEKGYGAPEHVRCEYFWRVDKARDGSELTIPMAFYGYRALWLERSMSLDEYERMHGDAGSAPSSEPPRGDGSSDEAGSALDYADSLFAQEAG